MCELLRSSDIDALLDSASEKRESQVLPLELIALGVYLLLYTVSPDGRQDLQRIGSGASLECGDLAPLCYRSGLIKDQSGA
ncbi:MAG TPA: hypothetical protein VLB46_19130, partial [Pyrinomonadaceae bacterium]|nr:hypothetical protein [Pyrinomonadaceae bacterium]